MKALPSGSSATPPDSPLWSPSPPNSEGFWWLYGDDEFGTMGGNYSGSVPPERTLRIVEVKKIGTGLIGISSGRMIELRPFDLKGRRTGYVGVWQKALPPTLPTGA